MRFSRKEASEFFKELREASILALNYYHLPTDPGFKTKPWTDGKPRGITFHYTAGVSWKPTIQHLNGQLNRKSSCTFLVLDRIIPEIDSFYASPILDELSVTVFMLSDLRSSTWHGNWSNGYNVGIENRNAGLLRGSTNDWYWWPNNWTTKFPHENIGKTPISINDQWWEPYTKGQISTNILIGQMLLSLYGRMDRKWFIPHSCVNKDKLDTGRVFPIGAVRDAIFDMVLPESLVWLSMFTDANSFDEYEGDWDLLQDMQDRQGVRDEDLDLNDVEELNIWDQSNSLKNGLSRVRQALDRLGYYVHVPVLEIDRCDVNLSTAIWMFQKSMGLKTDKIPGPKTRDALERRLSDFRIDL